VAWPASLPLIPLTSGAPQVVAAAAFGTTLVVTNAANASSAFRSVDHAEASVHRVRAIVDGMNPFRRWRELDLDRMLRDELLVETYLRNSLRAVSRGAVQGVTNLAASPLMIVVRGAEGFSGPVAYMALAGSATFAASLGFGFRRSTAKKETDLRREHEELQAERAIMRNDLENDTVSDALLVARSPDSESNEFDVLRSQLLEVDEKIRDVAVRRHRRRIWTDLTTRGLWAVSMGLPWLVALGDWVTTRSPPTYLPELATLTGVGAAQYSTLELPPAVAVVRDELAAAGRLRRLVDKVKGHEEAQRPYFLDAPAVRVSSDDWIVYRWGDQEHQCLLSQRAFPLVDTPGLELHVGGSGSGKSTFMRGLVGLEEPVSGMKLKAGAGLLDRNGERHDVTVSMWDIDRTSRLQHWAMTAQTPAYPAGSTVRDVFRLGNTELDDQDIIDKLGSLHLPPTDKSAVGHRDLDVRFDQLSGGGKKLVDLGAAFLRPTPMLMLDEPTAGLDARQQATALQQIRNEAGRRRVHLSTHDIRVVEQLLICPETKVAFLYDRRSGKQGTLITRVHAGRGHDASSSFLQTVRQHSAYGALRREADGLAAATGALLHESEPNLERVGLQAFRWVGGDRPMMDAVAARFVSITDARDAVGRYLRTHGDDLTVGQRSSFLQVERTLVDLARRDDGRVLHIPRYIETNQAPATAEHELRRGIGEF
jgi:ABC-type cobalamin/Fe3+-siderophores transport system ATPase subunit